MYNIHLNFCTIFQKVFIKQFKYRRLLEHEEQETAKHIKHKTAHLIAKATTPSLSYFNFPFSHFSSREGGEYFFFALLPFGKAHFSAIHAAPLRGASRDQPLCALPKGILLFYVKKEVPLFTKRYFQHLLNN